MVYIKKETSLTISNYKVCADWPLIAKIFHIFLAAGITFQLITGLMGWYTGRIPFFTWHTLVGRFLFLVILLQWFWLLFFAQGRSVLISLFPVSPSGLRNVLKELQGLIQLKLADPGPHGGLAGLMHGIFLLSATLVASAGLILFGTFHGWWSGLPIGLLLQVDGAGGDSTKLSTLTCAVDHIFIAGAFSLFCSWPRLVQISAGHQ